MKAIYKGLGGGLAAFQTNGTLLYEGFIGLVPLATIRGNEVYAGPGFGLPLATVRGNFVYEGIAGPARYQVIGNQVFAIHGGPPLLTGPGCTPVELAAAAVMLR